MLYYGYFRNIDTSIDPKGQLFKVEIFTQYSGKDPYPYKKGTHGQNLEPLEGEEVVLTDSPFKVEYANESNNIYKPYKCSSATVSFLYGSFNDDFINTKGNDVMVALLKWKNEVRLNGNEYLNTKTGDTLQQETIGTFTGFVPYKKDEFCYDVEWIGFSTPESYGIEYNNERNVISLNCQDAFSTLKYVKLNKLNVQRTMIFSSSIKTLLLSSVGRLGTYRNVYMTDCLYIENEEGNENVLDKLYTQYMNYVDENDDTMDLLSILEEICRTLSLTIVPFKNNIYVINYDSINAGFEDYWRFEMQYMPQRMYFNLLNSDINTYDDLGKIELSETIALNSTTYAETGTTVGSSDIFNKVTVNDDEYKVGDLIGDFEDYYDDSTELEVSFKINDGDDDHYIFTGSLFDFNQYNVGTDIDKTIMVGTDYESDRRGGAYPDLYWGSEVAPRALTLHDVQVNPGCCLFRFYKETVKNGDYYNSSVSPLIKAIYFHSSSYPELPAIHRTHVHKNAESQIPLSIYTKKFLLNRNIYFEIKGDWTFFNRTFPLVAPQTYQAPSEKRYSYINAIIRLAENGSEQYYLEDYDYTDENNCTYTKYRWVRTSKTVWCKLRLDWSDGNNGFDNRASFLSRKFYDWNNSIMIPSPIVDDEEFITSLEIMFERPLGNCDWACNSAILENFGVGLISRAYAESFGKKDVDDTNTNFEETLSSELVNQSKSVSLVVTSTSEKGDNFSRLFYNDDEDHYVIFGDIYNKGTCNIMKPEEHIINNLKTQYGTSSINVDMNIHYNLDIKPYTLFTWQQFPGKVFILDSMGLDYEMNKCSVELVEKKKFTSPIRVSLQNRRRNYHRSRDINLHNFKLRNEREEIQHNHSISSLGVFGINGNDGNVHWTVRDAFIGGCYVRFGVNISSGEMIVSVPNRFTSLIPSITNGELIIKLGQNMTYNLGKVLPTFKGDYSGSTTYEKLDVVFYNHKSYVALGQTTGHLPTDTNYWQIVAG